MIGRKERWQEDLFVAGPLSELIPEDHILKQVDRVLDLSWLRDEVRECYDTSQGRPGIDPEAAVRLMLAGLFHNIVSDRRLMKDAQVNIAIRWFAGYRLNEKLPDHSSLTRIRQRWGEKRFAAIFRRTVQSCAKAGLVNGETVHVDATLIRADVSWESLTERHVEAVLRENEDESNGDEDPPAPKRGRPRKHPKKPKKYSPTDPDATMTTSCKQYRMEPCFKQHTAVDDKAGVIVDVDVTTGEVSEGVELEKQIDRIERNTGVQMRTITADAGYGHARNYGMLEDRGIHAAIPPQTAPSRGRIPASRFKYDSHNKIVTCPMGKTLRPSSRAGDDAQIYRTKACDCRGCALRERCFSASATVRVIRISDQHEALLRARRRHASADESYQELYSRHRWRVEGVHGEAKTQHGLRRAMRRGTANVAIQAYLTATVMNLKRLAAIACAPIIRLIRIVRTCDFLIETIMASAMEEPSCQRIAA
ncbi:MAG: IS1182 family transposase [Planctomycetota bacterium]|jgi:transposase